ncbi:FMN-binding glutamate synthase family protein [Sansalvadorimonas sp. 2012CJ34-2]|uniref:FMN-binding glutamate synthase family protein n=1 Tax=Parendozoicomonas callyspongiae TaxID=2942213 RepID=A0ABT0PJZ2_9GAMM|nr:FMN-binding glutamate synthase family protein [Sansalvadorimonas sp. 2012CJ34-2]MCL6271695.1 FMN-binding glutamate synthase family protein [Sansalvadorimonas sp. 2012CJ34-2]
MDINAIFSHEYVQFLTLSMQILASLFILALGCGALWVVIMYVVDKNQTSHTVRRNYPVIGRFRYFFEHVGEFFRQYFFAGDREEMPFNRAQRAWVYRAAKNVDRTVAFGSSKPVKERGSILFLNCFSPTLDDEARETPCVLIGPGTRSPYRPGSLFNISGMSFGALSIPAVRALSQGAAKASCWMNTGEGGVSPYHLESGCDLIYQIGTAKYGVRCPEGKLDDARLKEVAAHEQIRMFEIKLSQGAKPGKGGILPAAKVTPEIARIRLIQEGEDSISPNRHPDIDNVGDLLDMIERIRNVTGKPTGIKFVLGSQQWLLDLCAEIAKRGAQSAPDFMTIDSCDGGTGAAPMALMDDVGLSLRESLPWVVNLLIERGLRERVRVICSGKMINPSDVAWALCMGADFCVSARGYMFALGCIQALQCNKNTCPTGITTHNRRLQRGLVPEDKARRVASYHDNLVHDVELIAHSCGVAEPRQLRRNHAREVLDNGRSETLLSLYPYPPVPGETRFIAGK